MSSSTLQTWTPAYIALGSNLDDPVAQIQHAIKQLNSIRQTRLVLQSSLYKSSPLGPQDQPDFINAVVGVLTQLNAMELLLELQFIEQRIGRVRPVERWGARIIDLDVLLYGESRSNDPTLQLPHPEMHKRNFVMVPLAEIAPALLVPEHGSAGKLAMQLGMGGLSVAKCALSN